MINRSYHIVLLLILSLLSVSLASCDDSIGDPGQYLTQDLLVQVTGDLPTKQDIIVRAIDDKGMVYTQPTDARGIATFHVPVGIYDITVSHVSTPDNGWRTVYNGSTSNVVVRQDSQATVSLSLTTATSSAIIIRELYVGGCQRDDGRHHSILRDCPGRG